MDITSRVKLKTASMRLIEKIGAPQGAISMRSNINSDQSFSIVVTIAPWAAKVVSTKLRNIDGFSIEYDIQPGLCANMLRSPSI